MVVKQEVGSAEYESDPSTVASVVIVAPMPARQIAPELQQPPPPSSLALPVHDRSRVPRNKHHELCGFLTVTLALQPQYEYTTQNRLHFHGNFI